MRFLIDEQLSRKLVAWFKSKSHEAEHVEDVLGKAAGDHAIAAYALSRRAVIVSKDLDFLDIVDNDETLNLLWVRTGNMRTKALIARLEADWARIEAALGSGQRVVELH